MAAAFSLVGQLGFTIALPIVGGALAGNYLDKRLGGTGLVLVAMILLGVAVGALAAYHALIRTMR